MLVLRHLHGRISTQLKLDPGQSDQMQVSTDAIWGSGLDQKRWSRTGMITYVGNFPIYTTTRAPQGVALCSTEVEYMALSDGTEIVSWLLKALNEMKLPQAETVIYQHDHGAIEWASETIPKHSAKRKARGIKISWSCRHGKSQRGYADETLYEENEEWFSHYGFCANSFDQAIRDLQLFDEDSWHSPRQWRTKLKRE